jgi:hypothetical protein
MDKRQEKDLEKLEKRIALYKELSEIDKRRAELSEEITSLEKQLETTVITRERYFPIDKLRDYLGLPMTKITCIKYTPLTGKYIVSDVFSIKDSTVCEEFIAYLEDYHISKIESEDGGYEKYVFENATYILGWYNLVSKGRVMEGTSLDDVIKAEKTKTDYAKEIECLSK